jgi:hypothetical protein
MKIELVIKYSLLAVIVAYYLIYTIRYAIIFKKNSFFTGGRKTFHAIMIWLFPFVWISVLKSILKPTPGSYVFQDKKDPDKMEDNTTDWVVWSASAPPNLGDSGGGGQSN